jgi:hypothetical protein
MAGFFGSAFGLSFFARDFGLTKFLERSDKGIRGLRKDMSGLNRISFEDLTNRMEKMTDEFTGVRKEGGETAKAFLSDLTDMQLETKMTKDEINVMKKTIMDLSRRTLAPLEDIGAVFRSLYQTTGDVSQALALMGDSAAEMMGLLEISPEAVAELYSMYGAFEATGDQIAETNDRIVALSRSMKDKKVVFETYGDTMDFIRESTAAWGITTFKEARRAAEQIYATAAGFEALGRAPKDAIESAKGLAQALYENRAQMHQVMTGLESEIPEMSELLSIAFGSAEKGFDMAQTNIVEFMKGIAQARDKVVLKAPAMIGKFDAMRQMMVKAFGAEHQDALIATMDMWARTGKRIDQTRVELDKSRGAFKEWTNTVRNAAETQGDLAQQQIDWLRQVVRTKEIEISGEMIKWLREEAGGLIGKFRELAQSNTMLGDIAKFTADSMGTIGVVGMYAGKALGGVKDIVFETIGTLGMLKMVSPKAFGTIMKGAKNILAPIWKGGKAFKLFGQTIAQLPFGHFGEWAAINSNLISQLIPSLIGKGGLVAAAGLAGYAVGTLAMKYLGLGKVTGWLTDKIEEVWNKEKNHTMELQAQANALEMIKKRYGENSKAYKKTLEDFERTYGKEGKDVLLQPMIAQPEAKIPAVPIPPAVPKADKELLENMDESIVQQGDMKKLMSKQIRLNDDNQSAQLACLLNIEQYTKLTAEKVGIKIPVERTFGAVSGARVGEARKMIENSGVGA